MKSILVVFVFILFSNIVAADELGGELNKMCENLKKCSLEKIEATQQLSPEMKKQMELMFEKSCASIEQNYTSGISAFPEHYKSALACVKSMANASCETLMERKEKSVECLDYEKLTEKGL